VQTIGIDLSMTSTGLAIYRPEDVVPGWLAFTRCITSTPGKDPGYDGKLHRFQRIYNAILSELRADDAHVYLEGPSYASAGSATHDIAGNWWLLYQALREDACDITVVPPSVVKKYATGNGNAKKDAVLAAAIKRYPEIDIPGNDIADAVILMAIGLRLDGQPIEELPASHLAALAKMPPQTIVSNR
jgi:crossover junction endodeoxyribonuclease RuvC